MPTMVTRDDVRFANLNKAHNARYPKSAAENVSAIAVCQSKQDVADALQSAISAGKRPTIRAGGCCYEDFYINNPNGILIDLVQLDFVGNPAGDHRYHIGPGVSMGKAYEDLYRIGNVTLPGASCTNVTAGGHITGGGFGVLSRLFSVTTDWVTEIEILTVDANGKVVPRTINAKRDPDLFRACRGSGGGNFGVITDYIFDKLPTAPQEIASSNISFPWADMTEAKFTKIMQTWGTYFATRGKDPDTWGIFSGIGLGHANANGRFGIGVQFCNPDGTCTDLKVLEEFIAYFDGIGGDVAPISRTQRGQGPAQTAMLTRGGQQFAQTCAVCHGADAHGGSIGPNLTAPHASSLTDAEIHGIIQNGVGGKMPGFSSLSEQQVQATIAYLRSLQNPAGQNGGQNGGGGGGGRRGQQQPTGEKTSTITTASGPHNVTYSQFIDNALGGRSGPGTRAKYKSTYKTTTFTQHECSVFYKYFTQDIPGLDSTGATVLIDSYGGAVNRPEMGEKDTVIFQRNSIMKHQFLTYWSDPAQDAAKIHFLNSLYTELYTSSDVDPNHQGTPYPTPGGIYQGCYMNYADADMLNYPYWPELYWGPNYKFLQQVKKKYDPNNVFHHGMSVRA